jgi:hypothetical protein
MLTIIDAKKLDLPKIHFLTGNNHAPIETLVHYQKDFNGKNDIGVFLGWLDQAIRTFKTEVQNNPEDFAQRVLEGQTQYDLFPTYDKEKARSIIEQISKDIQGKPNLPLKEIDRLCVNIILGKEIELNENQIAHKDLVKHLIISHLSQFSELIDTYKNLLKEKFLGSLPLMTQEAQTRVNKIKDNVHSDSFEIESSKEPEEMIDFARFKEQLAQENHFYVSSIRDAKSKEAKTSITNILHEYLTSLKETPNEFQIEVAKVLGEFLNTNNKILDGKQINTICDYWDSLVNPNTAQGQLANIISRLSLGEELN